MLTRLALENIAIIEALELEFQPGLNAITGETGSGKSLILDAIQRVFDKRSSPKDLLRRDTLRGRVELTFDLSRVHNRLQIQALLENTGIDLHTDEQELVLGRDFTANTSRCRVNGCQVSIEFMEKLGTLMLEIYGQHDLHTLFSSTRQRDLLDNMGGDPLLSIRQAVRQAYRKYQDLNTEIETLQTQQQNREREIDFLTFQMQEITQAELGDPNEDEALKQERERLSHHDKLGQSAAQATQILQGDDQYETASIQKLLSQVQKSLQNGTAFDPQFVQWYDQVSHIQEELRTLTQDLDRYAHSLDTRPERMKEIVDRLDTLEKLKRKYGGSLEFVIKTAADLEAQLTQLQGAETRLEELELQRQEAQALYQELGSALTDIRTQVAKSLEVAIQNELQTLLLPAAQFQIALNPIEGIELGFEQIVFMFSANPGEPLKPLAQVASGGELARLMLALKIRTAHVDALASLILDEIDTGMSGITVRAVSEKLQALQNQCQIIVITHQPIVAAKADCHIHVQKQLLEDDVKVTATLLSDREERKAILSQLASGFVEDDAATSQFIEQLLT